MIDTPPLVRFTPSDSRSGGQAEGVTWPPGRRRGRIATPSGRCAGNFAGVAVFKDGDELGLMSQCETGWERDIPEWRLHKNGSIRRLFEFSAMMNSYVDNPHRHHAPWPLDFAIDTPAPCPTSTSSKTSSGHWRPIRREVKQDRDRIYRPWRVHNSVTEHGGTARGDAYAHRDVWVLRWPPNEIDDGASELTAPSHAKLDDVVNSESVWRQDVVLCGPIPSRH
jgi:hypothetical protein